MQGSPSNNGDLATQTIETVLPPEMLAAILARVPRDLDPALRTVCKRWHDLLEPAVDSQGRPKTPRKTLLDTACWAALHGNAGLLEGVRDARKKGKLDGSGCWASVCRVVAGAWIDLRYMYHSRFGFGLESEGFRHAGQDLERLHERLRTPERLREAAIRNGGARILALAFPDGHRPPSTEDLTKAILRGTPETYLWLDERMVNPQIGGIKRHTVRKKLCDKAVWHGRLEITQIIYAQEFCISESKEEMRAWRSGHLALTKRLPPDSIPMNLTTMEHFERALLNADLRMANWFMDNVEDKGMTRRDSLPCSPTRHETFSHYQAILRFLRYGHDRVADRDRIESYREPNTARFCYAIAARRTDWEALDCLHHEVGAPLSIFVGLEVAATGNIEALEWLRDHRCPFNAAATFEACKANQLETLVWLWERGCPWHEVHCAHVARRLGYRKMLAWIHSHSDAGPGLEYMRIPPMVDRHTTLDLEPRKENNKEDNKEDGSDA